LDLNVWHRLYGIFLWLEFALVPVVFFILLRVTAPYGRHHRSGWGMTVSSRVAWLVMELPAVFVIPAMVCLLPGQVPSGVWVFVGIWEVHYFQRTFVFPMQMRGSKRDFPLVLAIMAFGFNLINGYVNGFFLKTYLVLSGPDLFISFHFISGCCLFLFGLVLNIASDRTIRSLRADDSQTGYRIPQKGCFRWVSNPNYLGEILEWTGWAVLTWSLAGLAFALFTAANLIPRGISNHRWYRKTFDDYPENRKILIPYFFTAVIIFCMK
jgi:3-oxo-5-alpha-steroid 4-dehydrogenase 1